MSDLPISVVIPLFNKRAEIGRALDSVLAQTSPAAEIIVVDDGSTDGSAEWVAARYGKDVQLVRQPNGGVSSARNTGIARTQSPYVAFLDADDSWSVHFLAEIGALIRAFPAAELYATAYQFCTGDEHCWDPKLRAVGATRFEMTDYFERAAHGDLPFMPTSACIKRSLIERIGGFPEGEPMGEDQDLWARAALFSRIAYSQRKLAFYHQDASDRACSGTPPETECPFSVRLQGFADARRGSRLAEQISAYTGGHLLDLAARNVRAGNGLAALALLSDPRTRRAWARRTYWQAQAHLASWVGRAR